MDLSNFQQNKSSQSNLRLLKKIVRLTTLALLVSTVGYAAWGIRKEVNQKKSSGFFDTIKQLYGDSELLYLIRKETVENGYWLLANAAILSIASKVIIDKENNQIIEFENNIKSKDGKNNVLTYTIDQKDNEINRFQNLWYKIKPFEMIQALLKNSHDFEQSKNQIIPLSSQLKDLVGSLDRQYEILNQDRALNEVIDSEDFAPMEE